MALNGTFYRKSKTHKQTHKHTQTGQVTNICCRFSSLNPNGVLFGFKLFKLVQCLFLFFPRDFVNCFTWRWKTRLMETPCAYFQTRYDKNTIKDEGELWKQSLSENQIKSHLTNWISSSICFCWCALRFKFSRKLLLDPLQYKHWEYNATRRCF